MYQIRINSKRLVLEMRFKGLIQKKEINRIIRKSMTT